MLDAGFLDIIDLKARVLPLGVQDVTDWDTPLMSLGLGVASAMNRACNRSLERAAGTSDEFSAASSAIVLRRYPVEEITTVQLRAFTGALDDFTAGYQLDQSAGLLTFRASPGSIDERLVVTYTGGYWLPDGSTQPAGSTPLPDDLLEAFVMQCQAWAEARGLFKSLALTTDEERKSKPSATELLPAVHTILAPHRRYSH